MPSHLCTALNPNVAMTGRLHSPVFGGKEPHGNTHIELCIATSVGREGGSEGLLGDRR